MDQWQWRLFIRIPDAITEGHIQAARAKLLEKKGIDAAELKHVRWEEGTAVQVLHIGPYDQVAGAYETLAGFAQRHGLVLEPIGHEVYLSDPRRVPPAKLKTIVRMPARPT
jgi:hypothetical protein